MSNDPPASCDQFPIEHAPFADRATACRGSARVSAGPADLGQASDADSGASANAYVLMACSKSACQSSRI
eukprot:629774-Lingulodinium_polyedra.AAC.1